MPETQLDRLERLLEKITGDVSDMKQITFHQTKMMDTTRDDIEKLYDKHNGLDRDVTALKTKASVFGTLGGIVSGSIMGFFASLIKGN